MSVAPVRVWGTSLARCALWFLALDSYFFAMSAWCLQKQVKNNAGKKERRFAVILTPFSSSKCLLIDGQKSFSGWWLAYMKYAKVTQKVLLELSLLGVWKAIVVSKLPCSAGLFWNTRIRWGWSATVTEGKAHFFVSPYWLVWDCVLDWVGVVLKCTMGLFRWTDFAHVSGATPYSSHWKKH